jgi:outer membrane protein insertion porin family
LLLSLVVIVASCSNTKHLAEGENLFVGSSIEMKDRSVHRKILRVQYRDLKGVVRPRPNTKTLGMRMKLAIYNASGGDKRKDKRGLSKMFAKWGEPPVLQSGVNLDVNKKLMVRMLQNRGFFRATADAHWKTKKRKSTAIFEVTTGPQYTISEVALEKDYPLINADIDSNFDETLLKPGAPYNLDLIKAERERIDLKLKQRGYYYFSPEYILVKADTSVGDSKVNMLVTVNHKETPYEAYNVYNINDVFIFANYRLNGRSPDTNKADAKPFQSYQIVDTRNTFKPRRLADVIIIEKGDRYSIEDQNVTQSRLMNLGTFKFVKNRFEPINDSLLDAYYYLTPFARKSLRLEFGVFSQSDNGTGSRGSISWRHRNAFRGGEAVQVRLRGGFESQVNGAVNAPSIFTYALETNFSFPRFVVPFTAIPSPSRFLPRTVIKLKYAYEVQTNTLGINQYSASYGYNWKESPQKEHQLFPINITYVKTDTLGNREKLYLLYSNLVFDGLIIGPTYEYTYNSQIGPVKKNGIYFDGLIDLSCNALGIAQNADYESNPKYLLNRPYAQYVKLQPDLRYYYHISESATIATRFLLGLGIPYGNSKQLPNIKQFWAGGTSDLRGFQSRLLGPGTFNERAVYGTNNLYQVLGDIKMEVNAEYRQKVYKAINLALFAEAGNVWLYRANPYFPGGEFTGDFYKQLGADVGVGLRLDFQILVLRLDLGFPVRKPWLNQNNGWVINNMNFADRNWRGDNMLLNIAIGYPF